MPAQDQVSDGHIHAKLSLKFANSVLLLQNRLRILLRLFGQFTKLLEAKINKILCGVLIVVILRVSDGKELVTTAFKEQGVYVATILQFFQVVL